MKQGIAVACGVAFGLVPVTGLIGAAAFMALTLFWWVHRTAACAARRTRKTRQLLTSPSHAARASCVRSPIAQHLLVLSLGAASRRGRLRWAQCALGRGLDAVLLRFPDLLDYELLARPMVTQRSLVRVGGRGLVVGVVRLMRARVGNAR